MGTQRGTQRSRMTAQSKVNIEAAKDAKLIRADSNDGYQVQLIGEKGTAYVENAQGPITYPSMATAKAAVKKHNSNLQPALAPTI